MKPLLLLTFSTVLLVKVALGLPTSTPTPAQESNEIGLVTDASIDPTPTAASRSGNLNRRKRISTLAFKEYTNLLKFQLERTHQIAKDVLADPTIVAENNEKMHRLTNTLRDYVAQSDVSELAKLPPVEVPNRYYLAIGTAFVVGRFDDFVRQLNATRKHDGAHTEQLLWTALQQHGYQEYQVELEKHATELLANIMNEIENYVKSLSPADREKNEDLVPIYDFYTQHPERFSKRDFGSKLLDVLFTDAVKAYE